MSPVMAILQDHLLVPSRTICSACSRLSICVSGSTENVVLKRRQFPRHRIILRQPLVLLLLPPSFRALRDCSEKRVLSWRCLRGVPPGGVRLTEATEGLGIVTRRRRSSAINSTPSNSSGGRVQQPSYS